MRIQRDEGNDGVGMSGRSHAKVAGCLLWENFIEVEFGARERASRSTLLRSSRCYL